MAENEEGSDDAKRMALVADLEGLGLRHLAGGISGAAFLEVASTFVGYAIGHGAPTAGDMERGLDLAHGVIDATAHSVFRRNKGAN